VRRNETESLLNVEASRGNADYLKKLTHLLALLVVKGESQSEKIKLLSGAGFSNTDIGKLLVMTSNSVNVALHRLRSKKH
jgi:hypothetical protein